MKTTEDPVDLQGWFPRVEKWERLGQMKKAGEKVPPRGNDTAQGWGYQSTRREPSELRREPSELSTDSTEGSALWECAAPRREMKTHQMT